MPPGTSLPHLNAAQRSDAATRSNATIARRVLQPHDSDSDTDVEELTKNPYALRVEQENKVRILCYYFGSRIVFTYFSISFHIRYRSQKMYSLPILLISDMLLIRSGSWMRRGRRIVMPL